MAKGVSFSLVLHRNLHPPPYYTTTAIFKDRVSPFIVLLTSTAAAFLNFRGRPTGGGSNQGTAPVTILGGLPSTYHASVVSIMFAFSCAFSAMFLYRKPQAARVFRFSAMMCLSFAFPMLVHAIFINRLS